MDSKRAKTYLIAFIAIINLLVLFHFQVSAADLIKYLLTLILATLVPGLLILNLLKLYPYTLYRFILAFALGIAADILLFMAFSSINLRHLIFVVLGIMILIYLKQGYCKNDIALLRDRAGNISLTAFILPALLSLTALVLIVWFYFLPNHLPGLEAVVYHVDYPWHLGNIAEILHHWYPQDPRIAGQQLNYHIFFLRGFMNGYYQGELFAVNQGNYSDTGYRYISTSVLLNTLSRISDQANRRR